MRERGREREREERSTPLCITAACGEDSGLKVVALELAIVHSLRILFSSESCTPVVFLARVFHVKYCVFVSFCISRFSAALIVFPRLWPRRGSLESARFLDTLMHILLNKPIIG